MLTKVILLFRRQKIPVPHGKTIKKLIMKNIADKQYVRLRWIKNSVGSDQLFIGQMSKAHPVENSIDVPDHITKKKLI